MKTIIQQLTEEIKNKIDVLRDKKVDEEKSKVYKDAEYHFLCKMLLELEGNYIYMEKHQMKEDFIAGMYDVSGIEDNNKCFESYFKETYIDSN